MFSKKNKKKKELFPRLLAYFFVIIACVQAISSIILFNSPEFVSAENLAPYEFQIPLGDNTSIDFKDNTTRPIADYINMIYKYAIGIVGIVAAVVLMVGGLKWLIAGGNGSKVDEAKGMIIGSLSGLVLVLTSYFILYQVNPNLVNLKVTEIGNVGNIGEEQSLSGKETCSWVANSQIIASSLGYLEGDKKKCSGEPDESIVDPKCGCEYESIKGCSWQDSDKCSENYELIDGGKYTEKNIKLCGSKTEDGYCCCVKAGLCENCAPIPDKMVIRNGNKADAGLVRKLIEAYDFQDYIKWGITEACPPSSYHASQCHKDCTCVDADIIGADSEDPDAVAVIYLVLTDAGLSPWFELKSGTNIAACKKYTDLGVKCRVPSTSSGSHFHIDN